MRFWLMIALLPGCAGSIEDTTLDPDATEDDSTEDGTEGTDVADPGEVTGPVDGVYTVSVNATDYEEPTYLDLAGAAVHFDEAGPWELRFLRAEIAINGGESGDGTVQIARLDGVPFDEAAAPESGWLTDAPDADEDGLPELAFDMWFDYDVGTHVLTPGPRTYIVRGAQDWRLEILSYYDDAGTSAMYQLRYALAVTP